MSIQVIAQVIAIVVIASWIIYKEVSERTKVKAYKLNPNPERCRQHAEAINAINDRIDDEILPDLKRIKDKLEIV